MRAAEHYTTYRPRWYRKRVSVWWWLESGRYTAFVLRELTSVFVAFFALVLLWGLRALAEGPEAWAGFMERLGTPLLVLLHIVGLVFLLYHSLTWFNLAPKAMPVRFRGRRVPDVAIAGANYVAWIALSFVVAAVLMGG